jgi:hypothetical protein
MYRLPMFNTVAVDTLFLYTVAGAALGLIKIVPTSLFIEFYLNTKKRGHYLWFNLN